MTSDELRTAAKNLDAAKDRLKKANRLSRNLPIESHFNSASTYIDALLRAKANIAEHALASAAVRVAECKYSLALREYLDS